MLNKISIINTDRLILKPLNESFNSIKYLGWLNDIQVTQFLEIGPYYSKDQLKSYLKLITKNNIFSWAIITKVNNSHIGNIKIDPINLKHRFGEYGILIGDKDAWGKGYAKEASLAVINFCFNELDLRKVNLGVVEDNYKAVTLYKKIGFKIEGHFIKHVNYNDNYYNTYRMAIFNSNIKY